MRGQFKAILRGLFEWNFHPVEAVKYAMEEQGLKSKDLIPYFGSKGIVSEFLNHKRGLSIRTIKTLHDSLGLPYEVLFK